MGELQLPENCVVHEVYTEGRNIILRYSGISSTMIEEAGWTHFNTTDYYGEAKLTVVEQ